MEFFHSVYCVITLYNVEKNARVASTPTTPVSNFAFLQFIFHKEGPYFFSGSQMVVKLFNGKIHILYSN